MCENQMAELDAVLPALRASGEAPFAMMVRGTTYRERAEAAPALLDSLGQAYVEGKRYGTRNSSRSPSCVGCRSGPAGCCPATRWS